MTQSPLKDIEKLIIQDLEPDFEAQTAVKGVFEDFPGPTPVLGRLEEELIWMAGWQKRQVPDIARPLLAVFAGTHEVATDLMGGDLIAVARKRVDGLTSGKAAARGIAGEMNAAFKVYEMGVEYPVADIRSEPALSEKDCASAIAFGMEVVAEGADIIGLGNAGTGSATAAAAICLGLFGGAPEYWAGAHDHSADARIKAVEQAVAQHKGVAQNGLDYLRLFGGRDISGLVGAIVAARHQSIPVILDGFVVCTAAAVIHSINPSAIDHCCAGSLTSEPAHEALLDRLGLKAITDIGSSLGDGTGAALTMSLLQVAAKGLQTMRS